MKLGLIGGIYNNYLALEAVCRDAMARGCGRLYCLGDLGAFGPHPDRVFPLLEKYDVTCIRGNYDDSVGHDKEDCQCGYTDPRDNHFAMLSYRYTLANTSNNNKAWLRTLPEQRMLDIDGKRLLLCHGSPRRMNEFLWESGSPTHLLEQFCDQYDADIIGVTHTGIHWKRALPRGRWFVNVGSIGRPANDGRTDVWYTVLDVSSDNPVQFLPVSYDFERLAREMEIEKLPREFVQTIRTGWWTTCLEILPSKERRRGRF